jgi:hypothetical protein
MRRTLAGRTLQEFADAPGERALVAGLGVHDERLGNDLPDGHAGVEAAGGVLEDDLHVAPEAAEPGRARSDDVHAIEDDRAGRGLDEAQDRPPDSGFARARLAHQTEGLAGGKVEGNAVHGPDLPGPPAEQPRMGGEVDVEVADAEQRRVCGALRGVAG